MKKVSVVIPIYQVEKYIAKTIESVLTQTYQNFEILVVDDGSRDRSREICQQFADARVKILCQENGGPSKALNTGICYAQGEYLAFLDGDDLWLPEKLAKHIAHLESSLDVGVSFSRSAFINETGQLLGSYQMPKLKDITISDLLCSNPLGNGSSAVFRRETLEAIKFQDNVSNSSENYYFEERNRASQDNEIILRIGLLTSWKIEGIPEVLTLYRVKPGGISANFFRTIEVWDEVLARSRCLAPEIIAKWEDKSKAYQLRITARTAVRMQSGAVAVKLLNKSLLTYWRILIEEPQRTLLTCIAAYSLWLLPLPLNRLIEKLAQQMIGVPQCRRFQEYPGN
ncbi:glycosyltransferase family 2 protein [Gloeocapsopsis dulcis]|uniref:Glucosyl transferase n=1 Tax=Gloeocapsopsis dulcis AAB1 = 1H9 TaxID=1433147 RepID=A0A6N8FST8_9CHRO|nr:glycosyltransferase family 2 protein [Gloeocapsopsis dulcis]MUL35814.1 glucosyl transferase [Gloeocapsopsis dulcis AAB1 = 1H9]WNN87719.1 glycosyltransferase family 2 protein [Gloeocapsopsis dulcis]